MPPSSDAPGAKLLRMWQRLHSVPGGRWLFNMLMARMVPYTGALGAKLVELSPGHAVCVLHDRHGVRNHLHSVHAVALANLAELCSGTAMLTALSPGTRGIVVRLEIEYLKKARGTLTARADVHFPPVTEPAEMYPEAVIFDAAGDVVAKARVTWKVEPSERSAQRADPRPSAASTR